jgi:hypothetical protein
MASANLDLVRSIHAAWEDFRSEAEEYRELDDERVLVLAHFSARGMTSGLEVGKIWTKGAALFHLRAGKVTRLVVYWAASARSPTSTSLRRPALRTRSPLPPRRWTSVVSGPRLLARFAAAALSDWLKDLSRSGARIFTET